MEEEKSVHKKRVPRKKTAPKDTVPETAKKKEPKKPKKAAELQYHGTGRRKTAVARVWVKAGTGRMLINGRKLEEYTCGRLVLNLATQKPLLVTGVADKYDVSVNVRGGGISSQIGAVCHGLARALVTVSPDFRSKLRTAGLLTRDPRMKERKKYGHKRARKSFQFSKR